MYTLIDMPELRLKPRLSRDGGFEVTPRGWRLSIPAGDAWSYRLAQMDDQAGLPRSAYPWQPPISLSLRARASAESAPGTWGFGLWNDPYGFSWGPGERFPRLPALPQAAWFFAASPRCYLSFRDDKPARGFFAQVFSSRGPVSQVLKAAITLPLSPRTSRTILSRVILEDGAPIRSNPCDWHVYEIEWKAESCRFSVDGTTVLDARLSPPAPLGLVIWIDNQYAAFDPQGRIRWGVEEDPVAKWLEVEDLKLVTPDPR